MDEPAVETICLRTLQLFMGAAYMFHVIDDEEMLRELLEAFITDFGRAVRCFTCGEEYLEFLNSPEFEQPIAVLSDITMPGISGYDLVLKIREQYPLQKIVLISGHVDNEHHERAASQLCGTLDKPFRVSELIALLAALINCDDTCKKCVHHEYPQYCKHGPNCNCPFHTQK